MPGSATLNGSGGGRRRRAGVAELADAQDLGSCTERCRGSTPLSCTRFPPMYPTRSNVILAALSLLLGGSICADTIVVGGLQVGDAKITRVANGSIYFTKAGK